MVAADLTFRIHSKLKSKVLTGAVEGSGALPPSSTGHVRKSMLGSISATSFVLKHKKTELTFPITAGQLPDTMEGTYRSGKLLPAPSILSFRL